MPINNNPADTVTSYLGQDSNISVAQLGNISAVEAIGDEINDFSTTLTDLGKQMQQLQKQLSDAITEQQKRQGVVDQLTQQVAAAQQKLDGDSASSSNSGSTNTQQSADQTALNNLQGQLSQATFSLGAQQSLVAGLQSQVAQLQKQIDSTQNTLNNLRNQALPAAQQFDEQSRQQQVSTHSNSQSNTQETTQTSEQMTLAARLRAQLTPGNSAASILDGMPYEQERQQGTGTGGGGGGGGGGGSGGAGGGGGSGGGSGGAGGAGGAGGGT